MKIVLELAGGNRGQTVLFRHYQFVEGRITLHGSPDSVAGDVLYLERTMYAFPVGTDELAAAVLATHGPPVATPVPAVAPVVEPPTAPVVPLVSTQEVGKVVVNGDVQAQPGSGSRTAEAVSGGVSEVPKPSEAPVAVDNRRHDNASPGPSGSVSQGARPGRTAKQVSGSKTA